MWFAVGIIGVIAIAFGVSLAPHSTVTSPPAQPPASAAPAAPSGPGSAQH
ncbi:MAG TPA: hypothetical protein VL993_00685 [Stellaceae bacterium]|nr:hypothetical protein [Stellaceae bacterium]